MKRIKIYSVILFTVAAILFIATPYVNAETANKTVNGYHAIAKLLFGGKSDTENQEVKIQGCEKIETLTYAKVKVVHFKVACSGNKEYRLFWAVKYNVDETFEAISKNAIATVTYNPTKADMAEYEKIMKMTRADRANHVKKYFDPITDIGPYRVVTSAIDPNTMDQK